MAWMTALAIGSMAYGAFSQFRAQRKQGQAAQAAGEAAQRAAESDAARLDYNAQVADLQAEDAIARGAEDESRFRQGVRGLIGSQRAGFAGQGVDVGSGSARDVQADAAYLGELDALTLRGNAHREAWGFREQATDLRTQADITRRGGQAAATVGRMQRSAANAAAVGTLVGTGGSLLWQRYGWGTGKAA